MVRRASQRPRTLGDWGLSGLEDGDQRGPYIFDRIDGMTSIPDLRELWRSVAVVLHAAEPLSWPFAEGEPPIEEARRAAYLLVRFVLAHQSDGAPDFEPLALIAELRQQHEARCARARRDDDCERRTMGGLLRYGGERGIAWRRQRDELVYAADRKLRLSDPTTPQAERCRRIADWWNKSMKNKRLRPAPPGVKAPLSARNVLRILTQA